MNKQLGEVTVEPIDESRGRELLDRKAQQLLGVSGDEFLTKWDRGEYRNSDHTAVMKLATLIPLAR